MCWPLTSVLGWTDPIARQWEGDSCFVKPAYACVWVYVCGVRVGRCACKDPTGPHLKVVLGVRSRTKMLCAIQVPGEPILTTAASYGTAVRSSLSSARLPQWSQTQVYTSNVYSLQPRTESSAQDDAGQSCSWLLSSSARCWPGAQLQLRAAPLKLLHRVLSALPKSWTARVGRANSSTRQKELHPVPVAQNCRVFDGAPAPGSGSCFSLDPLTETRVLYSCRKESLEA